MQLGICLFWALFKMNRKGAIGTIIILVIIFLILAFSFNWFKTGAVSTFITGTNTQVLKETSDYVDLSWKIEVREIGCIEDTYSYAGEPEGKYFKDSSGGWVDDRFTTNLNLPENKWFEAYYINYPKAILTLYPNSDISEKAYMEVTEGKARCKVRSEEKVNNKYSYILACEFEGRIKCPEKDSKASYRIPTCKACLMPPEIRVKIYREGYTSYIPPETTEPITEPVTEQVVIKTKSFFERIIDFFKSLWEAIFK